MKAEFIFPQELVDEIADKVCERLNPLSLFSSEPNDDIFDVKSLSQYLKVSPQWIYERTHLKEIPHIKKQGILRFRKCDIDKWLSSHNIPATRLPDAKLRLVK